MFLLAFSYILLYPLIFMISNSLKSPADFYDPTVEWVPNNAVTTNLQLAIQAMDFGGAIKNTFLYEMVAAL